ncbi:NTP transferase domain-containing protein [Candidatus Thioglobus sp.]|nr:NTP transferase domain-containing protein [Candidatus Thioglobus sp.]
MSIKNNTNFKLCILAAGKGTRNRSINGLHKALYPLENKAVISHIIECVPMDTEIIIAIGYKSEQVKTYIKHIFPQRDIKFIDVDNYDGPGSGPGLSLLKCKKHLQSPFIFTSTDTIIEAPHIFESLDEDWMGVSHVELEQSSNYCLVYDHENKEGAKYLKKLYFGEGNLAYVGAAGIYNHLLFWDSLENREFFKSENPAIGIKDEYQVLDGFEGLKKVKLIDCIWHDTGNDESYEKVRKKFLNEVVANKANEAVFIENGKVVKYFADLAIAKKRIERTKHLNGSSPSIKYLNDNMFSYDFIKGHLLSNLLDDKLLKKILPFYFENFAIQQFEKTDEFLSDCKEMYFNKTHDRIINSFAGTDIDKVEFINGVKVEGILELLKKVDWSSIYELSVPSRFHGDFQPENILHDGTNFKLIDWRDSFGKSLEVGDFYYDLGKLYHAIIINGQIVLSKGYSYKINNNTAFIEYNLKSNLNLLMNYFENFCKEKKISWSNVELLGILQYIGICSLYKEFHGGEYGKFLFLLGKYMLAKKLSKD